MSDAHRQLGSMRRFRGRSVLGVVCIVLTGAVFLPTASAVNQPVNDAIGEPAAATVSNLANGGSSAPAVSADGRYVAFISNASNLVPNDTNGASDVFVRDRQTGKTERVSVSSHGLQANGDSADPAISADGRFVAFESIADNLVTGDTNGSQDVFIHDRESGTTKRVSVSSSGDEGTYPLTFPSMNPALSADGRFVTFNSQATNLAPGGTSGFHNVFLHELATGSTSLVGVASETRMSLNGSISSNGGLIHYHFSDMSTNVAGGIIHNRLTGQTVSLANLSGPMHAQSQLSGNGEHIAYDLGTSLMLDDVFVTDLETMTSVQASVSSDGTVSNDGSQHPSIDETGSLVAFHSAATNLVGNDTNAFVDIFVRDLENKTTSRVSVSTIGEEANGSSYAPSLSNDGRYVAFSSSATNLVVGDTNGVADVFIHDRQTGETELVSLDSSTTTPTTTTTTTTTTTVKPTTTTTTVKPTTTTTTIRPTTTTVPPRRVVQGNLISVKVDGHTVTVVGRARTISGAPNITLSRNGRTLTAINATRPRADGYRGFTYTQNVPPGEYRYCAHFINQNVAGNYTSDCRNVTVK